MTERRYGLGQATLAEVEAMHTKLTRDLCAHIRELEAELAVARRAAELEADDANSVRIIAGVGDGEEP